MIIKFEGTIIKIQFRKKLLIISETLVGSGLTLITSTFSLLSPSVGFIATSSTTLISSVAILIRNEYISKFNIRFTKLGDWINMTSLLYEENNETIDDR